MKIKSYFAESIAQAMDRARELGPEAMLLNSKKTDPDHRHLGQVEVVFGVNERVVAPQERPEKEAAGPANAEALTQQLADLRRQLDSVQQAIVTPRSSMQRGRRAIVPEIEDVYVRLLASEMSLELAEEITEAVESRCFENTKPGNNERNIARDTVRECLHAELKSRFTVTPAIRPGGKDRIAMLVGPAGSGKTTTLVKLALRPAIVGQSQVQLVSADTLRVSGCEQLRNYARIANLKFKKADTVAALSAVIDGNAGSRLTLIDSPGYADSDMVDAQDLAALAGSDPRIEVHLVLPANIGCKAAIRIAERFAIFKPSRLILTHVDDGCAPGAILELAIKLGLPVSFLANGQQIPDDLQEASQPALLTTLVASPALAVSSAA
jgi:flagellar biosynthesis protein FlhF